MKTLLAGVLALACLAMTAGCDARGRRQAAPDRQDPAPGDTGLEEPDAAVQAVTGTDGAAPPPAASLTFEPPSVVNDLESIRAQYEEADRLAAELRQYAGRQGTNDPFALTEERIQALNTSRSVLY